MIKFSYNYFKKLYIFLKIGFYFMRGLSATRRNDATRKRRKGWKRQGKGDWKERKEKKGVY